MSEPEDRRPARITDPDGREVVFDASTRRHLIEGRRGWLLVHLDMILATVSLPAIYDRGDVVYLSVEGYDGPQATAYATPEGHNVEYDKSGRVVAMTLVNVRWLLERNGELTITWPTVRVKSDELAEALAPAA